MDHLALVRITGHHGGLVALASLEGGVFGVQAVFALLLLRAVALETVLGENRGDVLGEIDGGLSSQSREAGRSNGGRKDLHTKWVDVRFW